MTTRRRTASILGRVLFAAAVALIAAFAPSEGRAGYASIVIDADSHEILYAKNADVHNYPASLTKVMTLYLVFEGLKKGDLKLETRMRVSAYAAGQPQTNINLQPGDTLTVKEAILALVTRSANDAAVVVAEHMAGSEDKFAQRMTDRARRLGMVNTVFRNPNGLPDPGQVSTARDMATLGLAVQRDFPQFYHFFQTKSFTRKGVTYANHNRLLGKYAGTDGIKTGYTRASGFNLVSSVERDGRRLVAVVLGGPTARERDKHMVSLLDRGFRQLASAGPVNPRRPIPLPRPERDDAPGQAVAVSAPAKPAAEPETNRRAAPADDAPWGIQVGAYSSSGPAKQMIETARRHAKKLLDGSQASVERVTRAHGTVYRARLLGISEQAARKACAILARRQVPCVPVPGSDTMEVAAATIEN